MAMAPHPYGWNARGALYDVAQEVERRVFAANADHGSNDPIREVDSQELLWLLGVRAAVALADGIHDLIESLPDAGRGA